MSRLVSEGLFGFRSTLCKSITCRRMGGGRLPGEMTCSGQSLLLMIETSNSHSQH